MKGYQMTREEIDMIDFGIWHVTFKDQKSFFVNFLPESHSRRAGTADNFEPDMMVSFIPLMW